MTTNTDIEERLLKLAIGFTGRLPTQDISNATDLISRREWGVGLEVLCTQLAEYEIELTNKESNEIRQAAAAMSLDISSFGLFD
jgi:hypothetical protein